MQPSHQHRAAELICAHRPVTCMQDCAIPNLAKMSSCESVFNSGCGGSACNMRVLALVYSDEECLVIGNSDPTKTVTVSVQVFQYYDCEYIFHTSTHAGTHLRILQPRQSAIDSFSTSCLLQQPCSLLPCCVAHWLCVLSTLPLFRSRPCPCSHRSPPQPPATLAPSSASSSPSS